MRSDTSEKNIFIAIGRISIRPNWVAINPLPLADNLHAIAGESDFVDLVQGSDEQSTDLSHRTGTL